MTIYYSATTNAFYDTQVYNVNNIPEDKVAVAESTYKNLMAQQCAGRVIVAAADGTPTTIAQTCGSCTSTKYATKTELTNGLAAKANDSNVVHKTGDEHINGVKSFGSVIKATNGTVQVGTDTGYSVTFNYNGNITSKQARGTYSIFFPEGSGTLALTSDIDGKANDNNVVHTSGNEYINGTKTFTDKTISNKELHYKDTLYDWSDTSLNAWCDAGHVAWFDKTGSRRMHELVGANGGVWRKACYINENQYFSVDSNRNISYEGASLKWNGKNVALDENLVHKTGDETINGMKTFNNSLTFCGNVQKKNNDVDRSVKPTSDISSNFVFLDKNSSVLGYLNHAHKTDGVNHIGLYVKDSNNSDHGFRVTVNNVVLPLSNNTYSLGSSSYKWANVYATTFNGNLQGNADTATSANSVAWANVTGKPAYITATWRSGTSWYRVWSDGFIEQGGRVQLKTGSNMADKINFPKAFSTNQYTAIISDQAYPATPNQGTSGDVAIWGTTGYTTTGMFVMSSGGSERVAHWYACGY